MSRSSVDDRCIGIVLVSGFGRNRNVAGRALTGKRSSDTRRAGLFGETLFIRPRGVTHVEFSETALSLSKRKPRWTRGNAPICADPLKSIYLAKLTNPTRITGGNRRCRPVRAAWRQQTQSILLSELERKTSAAARLQPMRRSRTSWRAKAKPSVRGAWNEVVRGAVTAKKSARSTS